METNANKFRRKIDDWEQYMNADTVFGKMFGQYSGDTPYADVEGSFAKLASDNGVFLTVDRNTGDANAFDMEVMVALYDNPDKEYNLGVYTIPPSGDIVEAVCQNLCDIADDCYDEHIQNALRNTADDFYKLADVIDKTYDRLNDMMRVLIDNYDLLNVGNAIEMQEMFAQLALRTEIGLLAEKSDNGNLRLIVTTFEGGNYLNVNDEVSVEIDLTQTKDIFGEFKKLLDSSEWLANNPRYQKGIQAVQKTLDNYREKYQPKKELGKELITVRVTEWLKEQMSVDTNGTGVIHITPEQIGMLDVSDVAGLVVYRDFNTDMTADAYIEDAVKNFIYDSDALIEIQNEMVDVWKKRAAETLGNELDFQRAVITALDSPLDDIMERAGYKGISCDALDFIGETQINLLFATDAERDYEMGLIPAMIAPMVEKTNCPSETVLEENADNALMVLIHQQGYKWAGFKGAEGVANFYDLDIDDYLDGGKFQRSVAVELEQIDSSGTATLTACVTVNAVQLRDLLDAVGDEQSYVSLSTDTNIGLFDAQNGGGAMFEIELEKPAVLPVNLIKSIQVERSNGERSGIERYKGDYVVNSVYGFSDDHWKGSMEITKEAPEMVQEDISTMRKEYVKVLCAKDGISPREILEH